ncbi:3-deoxy-manno-octulosonate cytidylyltransferase [Novosphingobium sp.]|uniref:3-deoxy-manno-octulosonate cytidylyltransferase n=1 Tax=Novosphingobium sp. TaxID=1874826 RepID=UPI0038B939D7|nr:3-deoxy-manno-octulosonate cytidylyltransferase [Pseudomonadota bacterium]
MTDRAVIIVPARFASSRFPGKPLATLRGADGVVRPLIERSWRAAMAVPGIDRVVVATDDARIADVAHGFGAEVVMTPESCRNGTERCAAALAVLGERPDVVINLQGDAPLTPAGLVSALLDRMRAEPDLPVCTPALPCTATMLAALVADQAEGRVGGTTVVFDRRHDALYFSKRVIPHVAPERIAQAPGAVHLHAGLYAYRPDALADYAATPPSAIEELEGLEQLRFLDAGIRVGLAVCPMPAWDLIELNNPGDAPMIEAIMAAHGLA